VNGDLTSLVRQIDKATAENKAKKMGSFVVFLTDDKNLEGKLKELAEKEGIKKTVLTMDPLGRADHHDRARGATRDPGATYLSRFR
jgi:hypothetical protein